MKIILISDYEGLGKAGELIDVKPGFARNKLIPNGSALRASKKNIALIEEKKKLLETSKMREDASLQELLKQISSSFPNFQKKDISKTTDIILTEIKRALKREERVEIRGWGSLSIRNQKSSIRRNPKTGDKVAVPAKKVIYWKMSKEMFKKINNEKE